MTRTRSEVKRALSICAGTNCKCTTANCPYRDEKKCCFMELSRDALELMMKLEAEVRELLDVKDGGVEEDDSGSASSGRLRGHLPQEGKALEKNGKEE